MRGLGSILAVLRNVLHREEIAGVNATAEGQLPFWCYAVFRGTPALISERAAASDGQRAEPPSRPPRV